MEQEELQAVFAIQDLRFELLLTHSWRYVNTWRMNAIKKSTGGKFGDQAIMTRTAYRRTVVHTYKMLSSSLLKPFLVHSMGCRNI